MRLPKASIASTRESIATISVFTNTLTCTLHSYRLWPYSGKFSLLQIFRRWPTTMKIKSSPNNKILWQSDDGSAAVHEPVHGLPVPNPRGSLSNSIPLLAIAQANLEVQKTKASCKHDSTIASHCCRHAKLFSELKLLTDNLSLHYTPSSLGVVTRVNFGCVKVSSVCSSDKKKTWQEFNR